MPDPISDEELVGLRAWFVGSQPKSWAARLIGRLDAVTAERDELRRVAEATVIYMRLSGGDLPELAKAVGKEFDIAFPAQTTKETENG